MTGALATAIYLPPTLVRTNGRTVGKWCVGIAIICRDGRPIGLKRAAWREVVGKTVLFDLLVCLPAVGSGIAFIAVATDMLWPLGSREHLALHDHLAQTRVVQAARGRAPISAGWSAGL